MSLSTPVVAGPVDNQVMGAQQAQCRRSEDIEDYVLGRLEGRRLEAFQRHLRVCERCGAEVDLLQNATEAMPLLAARPGPAEPDEDQHRYAPTLAAAAAAAKAAGLSEREQAAAGTPSLHAIPGGAASQAPDDAPAIRSENQTRPDNQPDPKNQTCSDNQTRPQERNATHYYERNGVTKPISAETAAILAAHEQAMLARGGPAATLASISTAASATASTQALAQTQTPPGTPPRTPSSRRRIMKMPLPRPAIASLLGLAVVAAATVTLSNRAASIRYQRVQAGWKTGGAAIKLESSQIEILVKGMPHPASGTGYQVWVMDKDTKRLVPTHAWLHLDRTGEAGVGVPGNYHDWDAAAVYIEPLHGRETTESGAVVVADLRHEA